MLLSLQNEELRAVITLEQMKLLNYLMLENFIYSETSHSSIFKKQICSVLDINSRLSIRSIVLSTKVILRQCVNASTVNQ